MVCGFSRWLARDPQIHAIAAGDFDRAVGVGAISVTDEAGAIGNVDFPLPGGVLVRARSLDAMIGKAVVSLVEPKVKRSEGV